MAASLRWLSGLLLAVPLWAGTPAATAGEASSWTDDIGSSARLIAGSARDGADGRVLRAGLEIRLKPGWKTYWRYPGDSGVPPSLDFAGSDNVASVTVLYPAPQRFADGAGGSSIGYHGNVVLPLRILVQQVGRPATLRLKLDYAACETICVPAQARLELTLTGAASGHDALIEDAEARVPQPAAVGDGGALAIRAVVRETVAGKPRVIVDVAAPAGTEVALFAEGPTAQWALPLPEPIAGAQPPLKRFAFELDGLPPGATASGATLRLTAVAGKRAIEVAHRLD